MHGGVEHRDQELDDLDADPRHADRQGVGAQEEHGAHDLVGQRVADAGGMGPHEVPLQLDRLLGRNPHAGEVAESGRHAVDDGPFGGEPVDHRARGADPLGRSGVEGHRPPAP